MQSEQKRNVCATFAGAALAVVAFALPAAAAVASSTTVQASPSTATTGQSVDISTMVTCSGDPSGGLGMTLFDGSNLLTTVPVGMDGASSYTTDFTSAGSHMITAAYNGNDNCDASNSTATVQVNAPAVPPTPAPSPCLLLCNGLINLTFTNVGNIGSDRDVGNTGGIHNSGHIGHISGDDAGAIGSVFHGGRWHKDRKSVV